MKSSKPLPGIDSITEYAALLQGRTALFTNHTGRNSAGVSSIDVLRDLCRLELLFAPEHGLRGELPAGLTFHGSTDPVSGLPVISAYSSSSTRLPPEIYDRIDCIVYDVQDVGCRYYTYISSLKALVEDCAAHSRRLIVLDRPNLLGRMVDGSTLLPQTMSFVGCHKIPVRYGMTCGEFARMVSAGQQSDCDLHVVPCRGLDPRMTFPDLGIDWPSPSPNLRSYHSALLYPGTCLFEGTNCSEGRGTEEPFSFIGAPYIRAEELQRQFEKLCLPGVTSEPVVFTPSESKYAGLRCEGLRLRVTDETAVRSPALGVHLLALIRSMYPDSFCLLPPKNGECMPFISRLAGHREFEKDDWNISRLLKDSELDAACFEERRKPYLLY